MSISEKQRKALLKAKKRREKRPRPTVVISKPLSVKNGERNRYTQRHANVLLEIETTIADCYSQDRLLTDQDVLAALKQSIKAGETSPGMRNEQPIVDALQQTFERLFVKVGSEESRAIWIDGLRVIYSSVVTRSTDRDETAYLDFVSHFIRQTRSR